MSSRLLLNSIGYFAKLQCPRKLCTSIPLREAKENSKTFKNLLELYTANPSWIGCDYRLPKPAPAISQAELQNALKEEQNRKGKQQIVLDPASAQWSETSRRIGAIGIKLGVSYMWFKDGYRCRVTLIQIKDCHVLDTQLSIEDGGPDKVTQAIVGAIDEDDENLALIDREAFEWYDWRGLFPKKKWSGFPCSKDALLPVGTKITAAHFQPGQRVKIKAVMTDYGFQGVMKRHHMKGQPASHGQTKTHRKMGATGGSTDPGMIFPGKRMPGQMGGRYSTTAGLEVVRINMKYGVIYVQGTVPGLDGGLVKIKDYVGHNKKFRFNPERPPPFPTALNIENLPDEVYSDSCMSLDDESTKLIASR